MSILGTMSPLTKIKYGIALATAVAAFGTGCFVGNRWNKATTANEITKIREAHSALIAEAVSAKEAQVKQLEDDLKNEIKRRETIIASYETRLKNIQGKTKVITKIVEKEVASNKKYEECAIPQSGQQLLKDTVKALNEARKTNEVAK